MSERASELLDQTIVTVPNVGDVLVMLFTDCVMYVPGELMDGDFFHFEPQHFRQLALQCEPASLYPLSYERESLRLWLSQVATITP